MPHSHPGSSDHAEFRLAVRPVVVVTIRPPGFGWNIFQPPGGQVDQGSVAHTRKKRRVPRRCP